MRNLINTIAMVVALISFHLCLFSGVGMLVNGIFKRGYTIADGDVGFFLKSLGSLVVSYIVSAIIEEIERSEKKGKL